MLIKSLLIVTSIVISSFTLFVNNDKIETISNNNIEQLCTLSSNSTDKLLVPAILYEEEIIPSVTLETVDIRPDVDIDKIVRAVKYNNEIIPTVELNEIVVRPT